jgi:SAM-dependent methyltransferase
MHRETREIYDSSADEISYEYDQIGARGGDITLAFALAGNPENAQVLEIGCGHGRDAKEIMTRTPYYTGIDISGKMIDKAKNRVPEGNFEVADATSYDFKGQYDIVFAFAPFRHLKLDEVTTVIKKVYDVLRPGGIFYISSNFGEKYEETERFNTHGIRKINLYNPDIIQKHAPQGLKRVKELYDTVHGEEWFEVAFQKQAA